MVQKFLDAMLHDPKAKELIKAMPAPKNDTEAAEGYLKLAKDLGYDLTIEEIIAGLKTLEQEKKTQSAKVALDMDDLENVAGGANDGCADTHSPGEWCWFTDSCDYVISFYGDDSPGGDGDDCSGIYQFNKDYDKDPIKCIGTQEEYQFNS